MSKMYKTKLINRNRGYFFQFLIFLPIVYAIILVSMDLHFLEQVFPVGWALFAPFIIFIFYISLKRWIVSYNAEIEINDNFIRLNNKLIEWNKMSSFR